MKKKTRKKRSARIFRKDGFEYGYVSKPSQMIGRMEPVFRPHWWAQKISDGTYRIFNTKKKMLDWIKEWDLIANPRRKRRSMREKRVMQIKRGLMKRAKKLRLGAKRTGAYVYGTLRRIVGNPAKGVWSHVPFIRLSNSRTGKKIKTYPLDSLKWTAKERSDIKTLMEVGGRAIQIGDFVYEKRNALARARSNAWPRNALGMTITPVNYSGLRGNPMRSFASLHPSDRVKLNRFSDYVNSFYGKGGVYARDFKNGGFDRKTIERAIMVYIDDVRKGKVEWGDGDSIDRERVRMILEPSYSMSIPKGATILRPNRRMGLRGNPKSFYNTPGLVYLGDRKEPKLSPKELLYKLEDDFAVYRQDANIGYYDMDPKVVMDFERKIAMARKLVKNPPMYAHGMTAHRTHGLSLKQMMKLYRLVSSGNPKAVMFARRTLGIPMSENLQQVKAVVYHHVLDLKGKI